KPYLRGFAELNDTDLNSYQALVDVFQKEGVLQSRIDVRDKILRTADFGSWRRGASTWRRPYSARCPSTERRHGRAASAAGADQTSSAFPPDLHHHSRLTP